MFIVLRFSLSSAPFIFTKVMRCRVNILEKGRDKKFVYILMTVLDLPPLLQQNSLKTVWVCGFIMNFEKSVWQPQK